MTENSIFELFDEDAATANGTSSTHGGMWMFRHLQVLLDINTCATDSTDTLDAYIDTKISEDDDWVNMLHFPQITGTDSEGQHIACINAESDAATSQDVSTDCAAGEIRHGFTGNYMRGRVNIPSGQFAFAFKVFGKS
ncbi:MAG: hypothetical protein AB2L14_25320 [Candidatus Xenobiia bacterium LiM19]